MREKCGFVVITIGVVGVLFFWQYEGSLIPYPWFWVLVFVALIFIGVRIQSTSILLRKNVASVDLEKFKHKADKVLVKFSECELLSNNYHEVIGDISDDDRAWRATIYPHEEIDETLVSVYVLCYDAVYKGKAIKFYSPNLYMNEVDLKMKLYEQVETVVFVDKNKPEHYYFDMHFLYESEDL